MRFPFAFRRDFREFHISRDHADALALDRFRDALSLDNAEFAHGPFACLEVECRREDCVTMQTRILKQYPNGFSVCPTGNAGAACEGCTC